MFDTDDTPSNPTDNPHLFDMIGARLSRRSVLGGALAATILSFVGADFLSGAVAAAEDSDSDLDDEILPLLGFAAITASSDDTVRVPEGYTWDVLVPWGTPLFDGVK